MTIILHPFRSACPKCTGAFACCAKFCICCDDWNEAEHIHIQCNFCGYVRVTACADAKPDPAPSPEVNSQPAAPPPRKEDTRP